MGSHHGHAPFLDSARRTDVVVNAGGMYAPQIGRMVGAQVPIITYGHEFLVTEAFDPATPT